MTVEERLQCLERRANRYRNALVLLVMSVCAVALIGATADDGIIRAKGLFITNGEGMPIFSATDDGIITGKGLFITNDEGMPVLWAGVSDNGHGALTVRSKMGKTRIYTVVDKSGNGVLGVDYLRFRSVRRAS